jgi:ABC-type multidrug transport system ATPase subunit
VNIELSSVTRSFGKNNAVNGVSLDAGPGVLGLLGPNGAGKTSLLRMLATVLPPSSGQIELLGRDPGTPPAAARSGAVSATCRRASATTRRSPS